MFEAAGPQPANLLFFVYLRVSSWLKIKMRIAGIKLKNPGKRPKWIMGSGKETHLGIIGAGMRKNINFYKS